MCGGGGGTESEREREIKKGGREGVGGDWPSFTAQCDTHFSSLHTYSRDQGTGIFYKLLVFFLLQ